MERKKGETQNRGLIQNGQSLVLFPGPTIQANLLLLYILRALFLKKKDKNTT
jgi:hypothetical protein